MEQVLREWAARRGYAIAWVGGKSVQEAFGRIARLRDEGAFDPAFYDSLLAWTERPESLAQSSSRAAIVVAVPSPANIITFDDPDGGPPRDLVLPPTYVRYLAIFDDVLADLKDATAGRLEGLRLLKAPLKTLAVISGLACYGKNNIAYVEGFGSYVQLVGFVTETALAPWRPAIGGDTRGEGAGARPSDEAFDPAAAPETGGAQPLQEVDGEAGAWSLAAASLDECRTCRACVKACPTRAIGGDRFLLHGERCMTVWSEAEGPLPDEFAKARTPCLIGCMACQEVCPANKGRRRLERLPVLFTAEETAYLMGERGEGPPARELAAKVNGLGCTDLRVSAYGPEPILRRNLRALMKSGPRKRTPHGI
jgi:epoxyqueuosine reductase